MQNKDMIAIWIAKGENNIFHSNLFLGGKNTNAESGYVVLEENSFNNLFYNNLFDVDNPEWWNRIVLDLGINNAFNTTKDCTETNIIGGQCIGGNYWSDYNGVDTDGDGIGETPYTINEILGSCDYLPLTNNHP